MTAAESVESTPIVRFLTEEGLFQPTPEAEVYAGQLDRLGEADHEEFYRRMVTVRAFDTEATNLQRQGQMALWPPSRGQEGAQVGSAFALRPQDHVFPSYREHVVALMRGVDGLDIIRLMRGVTLGGWDPTDPKNGNVRLYTLVLAAQLLHATGYAMGIGLDGEPTGNPEQDEAVIAYFGDGASSEGDANESLVFASSYRTPQVFFLQNNQWAISVPVERQSRVPLHRRADGFGMPGVRIDGNDVLASYAATAHHLDVARAGGGPALIEALTYRLGAHTTSDDPSKYRLDDDLARWERRDPIPRFETYLRTQGASDAFFAGIEAEARDYAADIRRRTLELGVPEAASMFEHVYSEDHPVIREQRAWLAAYEEQMEGDVR